MNIGLLLAAGKSKRFKQDKLFVLLSGMPVIFHSLRLLADSKYIDEIFIVVNMANKNKIQKLVKEQCIQKVKGFIIGGRTRFKSVKKALSRVFREHQRRIKYLIIHNAVNPLATQSELEKCIEICKKNICGAAPAREVRSTIKRVKKSRNHLVVDLTVPRENLRAVETPQVVNAKIFWSACQKSKGDYTDDLSVLEAFGAKTRLVTASPRNIKLTVPHDLEILKVFSGDLPKDFKIGVGEDNHRFKSQISNPKSQINPIFQIQNDRRKLPKSRLKLGGVCIENLPQLEANSDGDVMLHALCNAINSALGKGSLGTFATKMCRRGIKDSKKYLEVVLKEMKRQRFYLSQCSISIEAQKPRIDLIEALIKKKLSRLLNLPKNRIGITATSGEQLTPFGRGEAIKCIATVLLASK